MLRSRVGTATKLKRTIANSHGVLDSPPWPLVGRLGCYLLHLQVKRGGTGRSSSDKFFSKSGDKGCGGIVRGWGARPGG